MNEIENFGAMVCSDNLEIRERGYDKWIEFDKKICMLKYRIALTDNAYIEITFKNIRMVRAKKREIFV